MSKESYPAPIVITGGAQRLGLAAARQLHSEANPVVITYRRERPLLDELRATGIVAIQADFSSTAGIEAFIEALKERYSQLRAIVHNASEWLPEGKGRPDSEVLQRMLSVHVTAPYLINQSCGGLLQAYGKQTGSADVIHLTDYVASTGSGNHIAYAASKAALENLALSFATRFAPWVKVNCIAPALLMFNDQDDAAYRDQAQKKSLLAAGPGEAEGVRAIQYILGSSYLTGKTIALDGGRHLVQGARG